MKNSIKELPYYKKVVALMGNKYKTTKKIKEHVREFITSVRHLYNGYKGPTKKWRERNALTSGDRELRRISNDKAFAKVKCDEFLQQIKKLMVVKKLSDVAPNSDYLIDTKKLVRTYGTKAQVKALGKIKSNFHKLDFTYDDYSTMRKTVDVKIQKNHEIVPSLEQNYRYCHEDGYTHWKNHKPVGYTSAINNHYIPSFGVLNPKTLLWRVGNKSAKMVAPDEYIWMIDQYGIKLCHEIRQAEDYHPSAAELWDGLTVEKVVEKININKQQREAMEAKKLAERAEIEGVYICLKDSIRAGNCQAGSIGFCNARQLIHTQHYPATKILDLGMDNQRVRIAIKAAAIRHQKEMAQGYALLEEHVL